MSETGPESTDDHEPDEADVRTPETDENPADANLEGNADELQMTALRERADALARRLHAALVAATGRLENPADLPFNPDHLDDADKLGAALDALLTERPYFAKRVVKGDAGQGARGGEPEPFSLLNALRGNA